MDTTATWQGDVLLLHGMPLAVRVDDDVVVTRCDLPRHAQLALDEWAEPARQRGLLLLDPESVAGRRLAADRTQVRSARWALWGRDPASAEAALRAADGSDDASPAPAARHGGRRRRTAVAVAAVVGVGVAAAVFAFVSLDHDPSPAARPVAASAAALHRVAVPSAGYTVGVPDGWQQLATSQAKADLLARSHDGHASMLLRTVTLTKPVDTRDASAVRDVIATVLDTSSVHVLAQQSLTVNGTPGYLYVYTFDDAGSGEQALHWHYFLFDGRRLDILVLQALPASDYAAIAPTFDGIVESFHATR